MGRAGQGRGEGEDTPTFQGKAVEQVGHVLHQHPRGAAPPLRPQPHHQVRHHLPDGVRVQQRLRGLQQPLVEHLPQAVPALPFPARGCSSALGARVGRGQWLAAVPQFPCARPPGQAGTIPGVVPPAVPMPFCLGGTCSSQEWEQCQLPAGPYPQGKGQEMCAAPQSTGRAGLTR